MIFILDIFLKKHLFEEIHPFVYASFSSGFVVCVLIMTHEFSFFQILIEENGSHLPLEKCFSFRKIPEYLTGNATIQTCLALSFNPGEAWAWLVFIICLISNPMTLKSMDF